MAMGLFSPLESIAAVRAPGTVATMLVGLDVVIFDVRTCITGRSGTDGCWRLGFTNDGATARSEARPAPCRPPAR